MPYITREDGERFIIPSYRDVLTVKKDTLLRREILLLSANYGEYISLQRKSATQYEVALSPEPGYLLGETVWSYFKRPQNLIYCEAIPNTSEAILVIVREGMVYLEGSFAFDAIPDELLTFRTQQEGFEIYVYGDVPISDAPLDGKVAFDRELIKSFTVLDKPVFPTLPIVKAFQLQLVDNVLKAKGIGTLPVKKIMLVLLVLGVIWVGWNHLKSYKKELPRVIVRATNPYLTYLATMSSPNPSEQVRWFSTAIWQLTTLPGWYADSLDYQNDVLRVSVKSLGARTNLLYAWAKQQRATVEVGTNGFYLIVHTGFVSRPTPTTISPLNNVVATMIDNLSYILPGNSLGVGALTNKGRYSEQILTITFNGITPTTLDLLGRKLQNLPLVLVKATMNISNQTISGNIILRALGS